jgi:hypothetical protein
MRELESEKQLPLPIPPAELLTGERRNTRTSNSSKEIEHLRRLAMRKRWDGICSNKSQSLIDPELENDRKYIPGDMFELEHL